MSDGSRSEGGAPGDDSPTPGAGRPLHYFTALAAGTCMALVSELLLRQPKLYLVPMHGKLASLAGVLGGAASLIAVFLVRRSTRDPRLEVAASLSALSLLCSASAPALFFGFGARPLATIFGFALPLAAGIALGVLVQALYRALWSAVLALESLRFLASPFRLLALFVAFGLGSASASTLGIWRAAAVLGLLFAVLGSWCPSLFHYLDRVPMPRAAAARWCAGAALLVAAASAGVSLRYVPLTDLRDYEAEVVFSRRGPEQQIVVVSGQDHFHLFIDRTLKVSGIDGYRYAEALIHPAMSVARRRGRVLLLGAGDGLAERELLRYPDLQSLTLVTVDPTLARMSGTLTWLGSRTAAALASPKLRVVATEPLVWLEQLQAERFDVVIADLPDPLDHRAGKHYTTYFYGLLARQLGPGGVLAVQATSLSQTPATFSAIERTIAASGLHTRAYRAALPSIGDWGFVLASSEPVRTPEQVLGGSRYVSSAALPLLFVLPSAEVASAAASAASGAPSRLYDQALVTTFEQERARLHSE